MPVNIPTPHKIAGLKTEQRSDVKTFTVNAPAIAKESTPGQFVMVWDPGVDEIPISIASASPDGDLELAIADVGDCSHSVHQKQVGDFIGLRGPYGTGFALNGKRICMVAGGYGAAPLRFAAERACALGLEVVVLEGARCSTDLLYLNEFRKIGCEVRVSTEDGSQGFCGMCTELFEELLASGEAFDQVLTCGPELMMTRVCELTRRRRIPTQVSVERIIKCSCGACGACDLGGYRVCKDGPVFIAETLERTEFGRWKREKSGKRIPIVPTAVAEELELVSPPLAQFTPEYEPLLKTEVCGIEFPNPFMNAAGFGVSGMFLYRYAAAGAGAVVTKSVGLDERDGYPNPTFIELAPRSYVNAMGLPNPGIANFKQELEDATYANVPVILSIFGKSVEECSDVARIAREYPVDMIEFDASCPHSEFTAIENKPKLLVEIVKAVKEIVQPKPVSVKISPNIGAPVGLALTAEKAGADAITAINTVINRPVEDTLEMPFLGNPLGYGGKSGKDLTVGGKQIVYELYRELNIPIIAVGGIFTVQDVIDYARNGASLFQIGSALVSDGIGVFARLKEELKTYLETKGYNNLREVVGEVHKR
ncbi:MAG TPA: dihydroorotate dehydrogenase electron transfer subunit [Desulfobacteria bacterium]|nr:dihydroorotate dehydrogenase electron transfer subunit [Desulfobacteria bacterium]